MNIKSLSIFLCMPLFLIFKQIAGAAFIMQNKCDYTVWPGILPNSGSPDIGTTGFELSSGESRSLQVTPGWSGRVWARTQCTFDPTTGQGNCLTGDCKSGQIECNGSGATPPATLAEFSFGTSGLGPAQDFYDVSLVDGFNVPMIVEPNGGSGTCLITGCASDLNQKCPKELRVGDGDACNSACGAFGTAEYCCKDAYASPGTCNPSMYSQMFKTTCPHAYSYAFDDATSTFTCIGADYAITFCPSLTSQQKSSTDSQSSTEDPTVPLIESGSGSNHHHKFYIGGGQFLSSSPPSSRTYGYSVFLWILILFIVTLLQQC